MKISDVATLLGATVLTDAKDTDTEVTSGYCCDLLSWVLAHGNRGMAWTTVQTHVNVVAIAVLMDMACVILAENNRPEPATLTKAREEGLAVLVTGKSAYEVSGLLYGAGIAPSAK